MNHAKQIRILLLLAVFLAALAGCGQKVDLQKQISGKWEGKLHHEAVDLKIDGQEKSVSIDGKTFPADVQSVNEKKGEIRLKVQNGGAAPEVWVLTQLWEDSDRFNVVLERGEHKVVLIPKKG